MTLKKFKKLYDTHSLMADLFWKLIEVKHPNHEFTSQVSQAIDEHLKLYGNQETMADFHLLATRPTLQEAYKIHTRFTKTTKTNETT